MCWQSFYENWPRLDRQMRMSRKLDNLDQVLFLSSHASVFPDGWLKWAKSVTKGSISSLKRDIWLLTGVALARSGCHLVFGPKQICARGLCGEFLDKSLLGSISRPSSTRVWAGASIARFLYGPETSHQASWGGWCQRHGLHRHASSFCCSNGYRSRQHASCHNLVQPKGPRNLTREKTFTTLTRPGCRDGAR